MKTIHLLFTLILLTACNNKDIDLQTIQISQDPSGVDFINAYRGAGVALQDSNAIQFLNAAKTVYDFAPSNPDVKLLYTSALTYNNKYKEAIKELEEMANYPYPVILNKLDQTYRLYLEGLDGYDSLLRISEQHTHPVNHSTLAYTLPEKGIIPEGVAYDKITKTLFISSIYKRKIIAIDAEGKIKDFIPSGFEGIQGVLGMEVDPERRFLWACSAWNRMKKPEEPMDEYSGIYKFDLETGKLIKKYLLKDTVERLINDVTLHSNGTAFITESLQGKVYTIQPRKDSLELFIDSDHYYYANGITLDNSERYLFIAHYAGVDKVNLANFKITRIKTPAHLTLSAIDGLAFYNNSLIAHQSSLGGIYRYYLNQTMDSVTTNKAIETNNPYFEIPTTGEIAGNTYYYIANAQLRRFNEQGEIFPEEKLDSVYILKAELAD
ncbi:MAG: hypothetical protein V2I54_14120 [Bacteroidales bacterium]|jgi:sugar lactone lactonase YvrE|nr:hypothetical protein [Bacteroidales bacterium]